MRSPMTKICRRLPSLQLPASAFRSLRLPRITRHEEKESRGGRHIHGVSSQMDIGAVCGPCVNMPDSALQRNPTRGINSYWHRDKLVCPLRSICRLSVDTTPRIHSRDRKSARWEFPYPICRKWRRFSKELI